MKIGLIGIGAIGGFLAKSLRKNIVWVCDSNEKFCRQRVHQLKLKASCARKPQSGVDLTIEAASQAAVPLLLPALKHSDAMIMSVGALRDKRLLGRLKSAARKHNHKIYIPSGAIGGLDAIKSSREMLREVVLETRKNPRAFGRSDRRATTLFSGNASEACAKFPQSVNVSATLALAGIGFQRTKVRIISDPKTKNNTHTIIARGPAGAFTLKFENIPSKENPKTSSLAMLAALRAVKELGAQLRIL